MLVGALSGSSQATSIANLALPLVFSDVQVAIYEDEYSTPSQNKSPGFR